MNIHVDMDAYYAYLIANDQAILFLGGRYVLIDTSTVNVHYRHGLLSSEVYPIKLFSWHAEEYRCLFHTKIFTTLKSWMLYELTNSKHLELKSAMECDYFVVEPASKWASYVSHTPSHYVHRDRH